MKNLMSLYLENLKISNNQLINLKVTKKDVNQKMEQSFLVFVEVNILKVCLFNKNNKL